MSELKCCPFCGGEAKIVRYYGKKTIVYAECTKCLAYMGNQRIMTSSRGKEYFESEEKLIVSWNTRTPMDNIVEKLKELKMRYFLTLANTGDDKNDFAYENVGNALDNAINIVKQEINNGLE